MRLIMLALMAMACGGAAIAQQVDASECENAAHRLRREAADLEDLAASAGSSEEGSERADAYARLRSAASDVLGYTDRVRRECGAARSVGVTPTAVLGAIQSHLLLRFGNTEAVRAKLKRLQADLLALATTHARVQPVDYRMTLAVAELLFRSEQ